MARLNDERTPACATGRAKSAIGVSYGRCSSSLQAAFWCGLYEGCPSRRMLCRMMQAIGTSPSICSTNAAVTTQTYPLRLLGEQTTTTKLTRDHHTGISRCRTHQTRIWCQSMSPQSVGLFPRSLLENMGILFCHLCFGSD